MALAPQCAHQKVTMPTPQYTFVPLHRVSVVQWHVSARTFGIMYDHMLFLCLQSSRSDIRPHVKWAVSLVITDGYQYFNLHQGFVWVCLGLHTHFITPKGNCASATVPIAMLMDAQHDMVLMATLCDTVHQTVSTAARQGPLAARHDTMRMPTKHKNVTIHQLTTMLFTSKNVLFPGYNHLLTNGVDYPSL